MAALLLPAKGQVPNKQRFYDEFGEQKDEEEKEALPKNVHKPEDYQALFEGNIDDSFRIGISVAKRTLRVTFIAFCLCNYRNLIVPFNSFMPDFTCLIS